MGVHITFVRYVLISSRPLLLAPLPAFPCRSVELDEWTPEQLRMMKLGGNANAASFFRSHGIKDLHMKVREINVGDARC